MARLKSVKAFTLVESLIAMVILLTGFSISLAAFVSVSGSNKHSREFGARLAANQAVYQIKRDKKFQDNDVQTQYGNMSVKITPWGNSASMYKLSIQITDSDGSLLHMHHELIRKE